MTNILEAIVNITKVSSFELENLYSGKNKINNVGDALERFIKDSFADTFNLDEVDRLKKYSSIFSWTGNQNHPPDIMIKGGDAIEVKKIQSANVDLPLNSSYPKTNIRSDSPLITTECRTCEEWDVKDLIYCIGHTSDTDIKSIWMVYGSIYAAKHETYQIIKQKIIDGIAEIPNVELAETNELGRVNKVDPLGITFLRIRGMWHIQNPRKVFNYIYQSKESKFELVVIIPTVKYNIFPEESRQRLLDNCIEVKDIQVKDPNNPAALVDAKLIVVTV